ncbi:MAG: molybdopterin-dependent oxidoreductase [Cypionkella sp.]
MTRRQKANLTCWSRLISGCRPPAVYSDIVLPTASWYEKDDLNTSDMHPFIHPLQAAVDPAYESKSDWEIFKAIAKKFSEIAPEISWVSKPTSFSYPHAARHPRRIGAARCHATGSSGECDLIPGKTAPNYIAVERDYPNLYKQLHLAWPADGQDSAMAAKALPGIPRPRCITSRRLNGVCRRGRHQRSGQDRHRD